MASTLAVAIERKNWSLAALCLLLGVAEEAARLPPPKRWSVCSSCWRSPTVPAAAADRTTRAKSPGRSKLAREFYRGALDAAERVELKAASEVEGLDEEIAVLRVKLKEALSKRPDDLQLMLRGIELLVKAVSARYRLSPEAGEDLSANIAGVVRGVGGLLIPEAFE